MMEEVVEQMKEEWKKRKGGDGQDTLKYYHTDCRCWSWESR